MLNGRVLIATAEVVLEWSCVGCYSYGRTWMVVCLSLQLRSYLNELMVDQLPILADLHTFLEHLGMMDPPAAKQELLLEQVRQLIVGWLYLLLYNYLSSTFPSLTLFKQATFL